MAKLTFTECFGKFGATLANPMWAVSAIAQDGSIVISCWAHYFSRPSNSVLRYTDRLSRWDGNSLGNSLLKDHIKLAHSSRLPVRLVVATAHNSLAVDQGWDASKIRKTFHIKPNVVGHVSNFDGDAFSIDFVQV